MGELGAIEITLILFAVGSAAGFINVMAGGGSTLSLPTLMLLGLDSAMANGTNRVAIFIQNIAAIISFKKEKYSQFNISLKMAAFTIPGAVAGAMLAINIEDGLFKTILGIIMIVVVITMLIPRKKIEEFVEYKDKLPWSVYLAMFGIGFYGGFIQVGVGFLLMAALYYLMKLSLVHVNMHKVFVVLFFTVPALIIFIASDNVNYVYGLSLAAGNALGGWQAAKMSVKKGEKAIKYVLIVAILIMALKILEIF